jgi:hypothetical protein
LLKLTCELVEVSWFSGALRRINQHSLDEDHSLRSDLLRDRSSLAEIKGGGVGLYSLADESGGKTLA